MGLCKAENTIAVIEDLPCRFSRSSPENLLHD
jgi:hypothetical protein